MDFETCVNCGSALDPFNQCWDCDTYGTPAEQKKDRQEDELNKRLKSNRPALPCCDMEGACTGGASCWADEPDNIPEDY